MVLMFLHKRGVLSAGATNQDIKHACCILVQIQRTQDWNQRLNGQKIRPSDDRFYAFLIFTKMIHFQENIKTSVHKASNLGLALGSAQYYIIPPVWCVCAHTLCKHPLQNFLIHLMILLFHRCEWVFAKEHWFLASNHLFVSIKKQNQ